MLNFYRRALLNGHVPLGRWANFLLQSLVNELYFGLSKYGSDWVWIRACVRQIDRLIVISTFDKVNTLVTLEAECRWNEHYVYIPGYSKCILKLLTAFWVHSKYSGPLLWPAQMFYSYSKLSKWINMERHSKCILIDQFAIRKNMVINIHISRNAMRWKGQIFHFLVSCYH